MQYLQHLLHGPSSDYRIVIAGIKWRHDCESYVPLTVGQNSRSLERSKDASGGLIPAMDVDDVRAAHEQAVGETPLAAQYEQTNVAQSFSVGILHLRSRGRGGHDRRPKRERWDNKVMGRLWVFVGRKSSDFSFIYGGVPNITTIL